MIKDFKASFFFLRLPIAISLLGHGLVRLPKLADFANGMANSMEKSILPYGLVLAFGYVLPLVETILGIALTIGFKTKYTLYGCLSLMSILIFGSATVENWNAVQAQLVHGIYLAFLLVIFERFFPAEKV